MGKLLQNRKHERRMRKAGQSNQISAKDVHMEALENPTEQGKEPDKTGDQSQICVVNSVLWGTYRPGMPGWSNEYSGY